MKIIVTLTCAFQRNWVGVLFVVQAIYFSCHCMRLIAEAKDVSTSVENLMIKFETPLLQAILYQLTYQSEKLDSAARLTSTNSIF